MAEEPPSQGTDPEQKKSSEENRENEDQNKSDTVQQSKITDKNKFECIRQGIIDLGLSCVHTQQKLRIDELDKNKSRVAKMDIKDEQSVSDEEYLWLDALSEIMQK